MVLLRKYVNPYMTLELNPLIQEGLNHPWWVENWKAGCPNSVSVHTDKGEKWNHCNYWKRGDMVENSIWKRDTGAFYIVCGGIQSSLSSTLS
jgi:hypothetical protein